MISSDVQAVFFDAVGTLIVPEPPVAAVYAAVGKRHGCELRTDQVAKRFRAAFDDEEKRDAQAGWAVSEEREVRRWRSIVGQVLGEHPHIELIFDELYRHFARPEAWRVLDGVGQVMEELAGRGLELGVGSNFDRRLHEVLTGHAEFAPLTHRIVSSEVGWRKPSPHFFTTVSRVSGCALQRILFVGDDRRNDYDAAIAAGIQALLVAARPLPGVQCIAALAELIG